jgi:hypothetical protein
MTAKNAKPKPGPKHKQLEPLIGDWRTSGSTIATASEPAIEFNGTDSYEWLEGGFFVLHRVDVLLGGQPVKGVETIWYDPPSGAYRTHFVDVGGNTSAYEVRLDGRTWTMASQSERFSGSFSEDRKTLSGRWERKGGGSNWELWMDVTLMRVT